MNEEEEEVEEADESNLLGGNEGEDSGMPLPRIQFENR